MTRITPTTLSFLKKLSKHNDRAWFDRHKVEYLDALDNATAFVDGLITLMNKHDRIETPSGKKSLYRIYNDVRFSKDKTPYNPRFGGYLKRDKPWLRGGYYYWIKPGGSHVSCGFAYPGSDDLKRIRFDISDNYDEWKSMLGSAAIRKIFGSMQGEKLNTAPRGFSANDPAIELLRYKQFWFSRSFSDAEVLAPDFLQKVNKTFKTIRPFFDYMSEILATDRNGETLIKGRDILNV